MPAATPVRSRPGIGGSDPGLEHPDWSPDGRLRFFKPVWSPDDRQLRMGCVNYSISGSTTSFVDPVETAFFRAAAAGVFVSASGGNSGPAVGTVAHNSPWLTTVAASTHDRAYDASATPGNGQTYDGAGLGTAVQSSPLVYAGGVGMILGNTPPNSITADLHFVPTVHVNDTERSAVLAYLNGAANPTASLSAGVEVIGVKAPLMAAFSSRGPAKAGSGDLIKPDITAPGVDVLAAYAPTSGGYGHNFDVQSAHGRPRRADDPGASELDPDDDQVLADDDGVGARQHRFPDSQRRRHRGQPVQLRLRPRHPDVGAEPRRRVQQHRERLAPLRLRHRQGGPGWTQLRNDRQHRPEHPAVLTLGRNKSATVTITITRTTAPLNAYTFGSLTWTPQTQSGVLPSAVRIPIAVKPA